MMTRLIRTADSQAVKQPQQQSRSVARKADYS